MSVLDSGALGEIYVLVISPLLFIREVLEIENVASVVFLISDIVVLEKVIV